MLWTFKVGFLCSHSDRYASLSPKRYAKNYALFLQLCIRAVLLLWFVQYSFHKAVTWFLKLCCLVNTNLAFTEASEFNLYSQFTSPLKGCIFFLWADCPCGTCWDLWELLLDTAVTWCAPADVHNFTSHATAHKLDYSLIKKDQWHFFPSTTLNHNAFWSKQMQILLFD